MFGLIPFRMTRGNNTTISSLTDLFDNFFNDDFTAAFNGSNDIKADVRETNEAYFCLLYTSPSPRDLSTSRMPSSA